MQEFPDGKLNVFISYSRENFDFADQLDESLKLTGFATTLDRHGISGGEEWRKRLGGLIRDADTVVFVLSPASARSDICKWEVEEAVRLGKRILPVLCAPLEGEQPPSQLSDLDYIFFYPEPKSPRSGFGSGLSRLVTALQTDLAWLREHTRLLQRATEWQQGSRPGNRLLSGADIEAAKSWAARRPKNAPSPTPLHLDFIQASERGETERQSTERLRLDEREQLVRQAEMAQHAKDEATRRLVRHTTLGGAIAIVLAIVAVGFGFFAWQKQQEAEAGKLEATNQRQRAEANFHSMNQALALVDPSLDAVSRATKFFDLAGTYASEEQLSVAETLYRQSHGLRASALDASHPDTNAAQLGIALTIMRQDRLDEADPLLAAALANAKSGTIPSASVTRFGPVVQEQYRRRGRNAEAGKWAMLIATVVARQTCPNVYSVSDLTNQPEAPQSSISAQFHPVFARLVANTSKSFACQGMINYYASNMGMAADIVEDKNETRGNVNEIDFGNKSHKSVCGTIRFEVPLGLPGYDPKTNFGSWANGIDRLLSSRGATEVENKHYLSLSNMHSKSLSALCLTLATRPTT